MSVHDVMAAAGKLKSVKRQGWLDAGIPAEQVESVADHSFRVAFMAAFLAPRAIGGKSGRTRQRGLDVLKMVRMALVHDLAESVVGDLTPRSGVPPKMKARMEEEAMRSLGDRGLLAIWKEYEAGRSPEANLVREADVAERVITAHEYIGTGHPAGRLAHFLEGGKYEVKGREFLALLDGCIHKRTGKRHPEIPPMRCKRPVYRCAFGRPR